MKYHTENIFCKSFIYYEKCFPKKREVWMNIKKNIFRRRKSYLQKSVREYYNYVKYIFRYKFSLCAECKKPLPKTLPKK